VELQRRVSRLVGSLKESPSRSYWRWAATRAQRRKFLLDASQGITVEAVIDLVKAASAAEGQTVSHSMLRMLSKLAHHPSAGGPRQKNRPDHPRCHAPAVDDWSLDDPNPEAYRKVLENMSTSNGDENATVSVVPTACEPERMVPDRDRGGSYGATGTGGNVRAVQVGARECSARSLSSALPMPTRAPRFGSFSSESVFSTHCSASSVSTFHWPDALRDA